MVILLSKVSIAHSQQPLPKYGINLPFQLKRVHHRAVACADCYNKTLVVGVHSTYVTINSHYSSLSIFR